MKPMALTISLLSLLTYSNFASASLETVTCIVGSEGISKNMLKDANEMLYQEIDNVIITGRPSDMANKDIVSIDVSGREYSTSTSILIDKQSKMGMESLENEGKFYHISCQKEISDIQSTEKIPEQDSLEIKKIKDLISMGSKRFPRPPKQAFEGTYLGTSAGRTCEVEILSRGGLIASQHAGATFNTDSIDIKAELDAGNKVIAEEGVSSYLGTSIETSLIFNDKQELQSAVVKEGVYVNGQAYRLQKMKCSRLKKLK